MNDEHVDDFAKSILTHEEFCKRLDNLWKKKTALERDCRILFYKIEAIPELDKTNPDGSCTLNNEQRSIVFKRFKYLRLIDNYANIITCSKALGYYIKRDSSGKHSLVPISDVNNSV